MVSEIIIIFCLVFMYIHIIMLYADVAFPSKKRDHLSSSFP